MFAVKIFNKKNNRNNIFKKSIDKIKEYISNSLNIKDLKVASDSECIEFISGIDYITKDDDKIIAELLVKKTFVINKDDLNDKQKLDEFLVNIKHFCEQAKNIEDAQYLPINMRK